VELPADTGVAAAGNGCPHMTARIALRRLCPAFACIPIPRAEAATVTSYALVVCCEETDAK
jgi:hypothetical protein